MAFHVQNVKKQKTRSNFTFNASIGGAIPLLLLLALLVLLPFVFIFIYAITNKGESNYIYLTFDNFAQFITEPNFLRSAGMSIYFAFIATLICLVIGYPVAYFIGRSKASLRNILVMLITIPMWINMLLRILAWKQIFELFEKWMNVEIIGTDFAILFGMAYDLLPFMIIPIYTSVMKIDPSLYEASKDLGANPIKTFFKVTIPLSMPGIISGITMVFLPAATTLVVTEKLGGGKSRYFLIGNIIESYFIRQTNPYVGSAIALILSVIIFLVIFLLNRLDRTIVRDRELTTSVKKRRKA